MDTYFKISFSNLAPGMSDVLVALLSEQGYEGFEEGEDALAAFIPATDFQEEILSSIVSDFNLVYTKASVQPQNWNAIWEQSFEPVVLPGFAAVRASFHDAIPGLPFDIVITPKMSFGTGHHATTLQMMQLMRELDMKQKKVFDFGTGTGVLAILAEKMGASDVVAIDNDAWSIENTIENIACNDCSCIRALRDDQPPASEKFDIVLANITRSALVQHMEAIAHCMHDGAFLLVSGFYADENHLLETSAASCGLLPIKSSSDKDWSAIQFLKQASVHV